VKGHQRKGKATFQEKKNGKKKEKETKKRILCGFFSAGAHAWEGTIMLFSLIIEKCNLELAR
jgi:hypothetical protein